MILEASLVKDGVSKFWRLRRAPQNKDRPAIRFLSDPLLQKHRVPLAKGTKPLQRFGMGVSPMPRSRAGRPCHPLIAMFEFLASEWTRLVFDLRDRFRCPTTK
jgi:hypothetical protein